LTEAAKEARKRLQAYGYETDSFFEQTIVWGDHDSFQHVNNVRYVRFFESGRIAWLSSLANELGGPEKVDAMLKGRGVSLILKRIAVDFKRPVTFPDTLLIAHKAVPLDSPSHFKLLAGAYSYAQRTIVAESEAVLVWYDYDALSKCHPGEKALGVLQRRMRTAEAEFLVGSNPD